MSAVLATNQQSNKLSSLGQIRIVLVEPTHPGNIGSVARAMKTMGLSRLVLVNPKKFPHPEKFPTSEGQTPNTRQNGSPHAAWCATRALRLEQRSFVEILQVRHLAKDILDPPLLPLHTCVAGSRGWAVFTLGVPVYCCPMTGFLNHSGAPGGQYDLRTGMNW